MLVILRVRQKRMKTQHIDLLIKTKAMIDYFIEMRGQIAEHVFKYSDNTTINIPVNFKRTINNISKELKYQSNSLVNITPLEMYQLIDDNYRTLENLHFGKPTELFKSAYKFHLSPKNLLAVKRFNRKGLEMLCAKIKSAYMNALCNPGEMVGMVLLRSLSESRLHR